MAAWLPISLVLSLLACDSGTDDGVDDGGPTWHDADLDGYTDNVDCNDADAQINPAASEVCDRIDNDCDGWVDDDDRDLALYSAQLWYRDQDGDGYGTWEVSALACDRPRGFADNAADCVDDDASISPLAIEQCDGIDNDCSGRVDDNAVDAPTWLLDGDGDGYGVDGVGLVSCAQPEGTTALDGDCDDTEALLNPGALELCNDTLDNDCDGAAVDSCMLDLDLADVTIRGVAPYDDVGIAILGLGDLNADGVDDLAVGVRSYDGTDVDAGAFFVQYGPIENLGSVTIEDLDVAVLGEYANDKAGRTLAAGDLDGDGITDIVTGAPNSDFGGNQSGTVYVVSGADLPAEGELGLDEAIAQVWGAGTYDYLGVGVQVVDAGADGVLDLVLGASGVDTGANNAGALYLVEGPVLAGTTLDLGSGDYDARWLGLGDTDSIGMDYCAQGDADGDGQPDLLIGAGTHDYVATDAGVVYLISGIEPGDHTVDDAFFTLHGDASNQQLGSAVSCIGDWNTDGYDDFAIGEVGHDGDFGENVGAVHVVHGAAAYDVGGMVIDRLAVATIEGVEAEDQLGGDLGGMGDHDGDGTNDLLMGAINGGESAEGAAYLVYGPITGTRSAADADATYAGAFEEDHAGYLVSYLGDIAGRGVDAIAIGALDADAPTADNGAAYLVLETGL